MKITERIDHRLALPGDDETLIVQKRLGLLIMFPAALFTALFGVTGLATSNPELGRHYLQQGVLILIFGIVFWFVPRWWRFLIAGLILLGTLEPLYAHMISGGYTAGTMEIVWTLIGPTLAVLFFRPAFILLITALSLGVLITGGILDPIALARAPEIAYSERVATTVGIISVMLVFIVAASLYLFRQLENARRRADDLLLNILPEPISRRLKAAPDTIADGFDEATVLFADIVDFTTMSAAADPIAIVNKLNDVFSDFDELARRHGLEKIKTIGDAYMVAAGLPDPRPDHIEAVVEFAREMLDVVGHHTSWTGDPIRLRVGVNTGPVVAGVIGRHKFIYDLWGDAVNVASRMESHGLANRIQVTQPVRDRLGGRYTFEPRGPIDIKGKGPMMTYLLSPAAPGD